MMFVDPWGLRPGDLIESSLEGLSEQSINNINLALEERSKGIISAEEAAKNIVLNGGEVEKFDKYRVEENGNDIIITSYVSINVNSDLNKTKNPLEASEDTYINAICNGITEQWSGEYKGKNIKTNVVILDENNGVYETQSIDLSLYGHPGVNSGDIHLYDRTTEGEFSIKRFKEVVAHEFGHAAFNLIDLYKYKQYRHCNSIMTSKAGVGRTEADFAMMSRNELFKDTSIYESDSLLNVLSPYL